MRLARELIERGELGEIRHFRGRYLQDWGDDPSLDTWRFHPDEAGSGALGDLGTHVIDLARFLVGEIATVSGLVHTFVPGRQVDDALEAAVEFAGGAVGTIEATRLALGRRNAFQWEINGSEGSLYFDMERMNELQVFRDDGDRARGFRTVLVTEADHPFMEHWWPPGHIVGWGDTFVHEAHHLLQAIAERRRRRALRRDVRGRLPRVGDRRRDRPLERERARARRSSSERSEPAGRLRRSQARCSRTRSATDSSSSVEPGDVAEEVLGGPALALAPELAQERARLAPREPRVAELLAQVAPQLRLERPRAEVRARRRSSSRCRRGSRRGSARSSARRPSSST